jgi:HD-GYP domain-containing protein (c-di-GMP phosphodiesterase class II)
MENRVNSILERMPTSNLKVGLYVERLDRPWTETPFLFQGFYIHDHHEIEQLKHYCQYVYVDALKSSEPPLHSGKNEEGVRHTAANTPDPVYPISHTTPPGTRRKCEVYVKTRPVEREISAAGKAHADASRVAASIITGLRLEGRLDVDLVRQTVEPMMESMLRNPDALIWLSRMRRHDSYIYEHSVNCSIWGMAFARHLGLDKGSIYEVGLGCMLFDVGKTRLPRALLAKPGKLTPDEWRVVQGHIAYGISILEDTGDLSAGIIDMVRSHHERFDGSGYPSGLQGDQIPTFAKIAGMVDCYDALVSQRPYASQRSPHEAMRELYAWRGGLFQPEVVERFMQVVGVFPTGSLVELNTGSVGVVIAQNDIRRLRPRIMLLLGNTKQRLPDFKIVDLLHDPPWDNAKEFWIDKGLEPGAYGIDPQQLYL